MRTGIVLAALLGAGCDRLEGGGAGPAPAEAASPAVDVEQFAGRSYAEFAAQDVRFSPTGLGVTGDDANRLARVMAVSSGTIVEGGGARALVFRGCAEAGCEAGKGVVAIDVATGLAFGGVRDGDGKDVLVNNERLEALLRVNSPARDWID